MFVVIFVVFPIDNVKAVWYNSDWYYRKDIWIDKDQIDNDLVNYPFLVYISSDNDFVSHAQVDGDDFIFVSSDNVTKYAHEIEEYNSTTGELVVWVNITNIDSSVDTHLNVYYGNASASNQQNSVGVWDSDYIAVYHLTGSNSDSLVDSTSNKLDVPVDGVDDIDTRESCIIYARQFDDNTEEFKNLSDMDILDPKNNDFSVSFWVNTTATTYTDVLRKHNSWKFHNEPFWYLYDIDGNVEYEQYEDDHRKGSWYMMGMTIDRTADVLSIWVNDSFESQTENIAGFGSINNDSDTRFDFGRMQMGADELRISKTVRNSSWLMTQYNNVVNKTSIISLSSEYSNSVNNLPVVDSYSPSDSSTGHLVDTVCSVTVSDVDGDTLNVSFASNFTGSYVIYQTNKSVGNGSYSWNPGFFRRYGYRFYWRVFVDDNVDNVSAIYSFVTVNYNFFNMSSTWYTVNSTYAHFHTFSPVHFMNTSVVNVSIDGSVRRYLAYDSHEDGNWINLYYTNELNGTWSVYTGNPILNGNGLYRWPSVIYYDNKFHMILCNHSNSKLEYWYSNDAISYSYVCNVSIVNNTGWLNPWFWFDYNTNLFYIYYKESSTPRNLWVNKGSTIDLCVNDTSHRILDDNDITGTCASPCVFYAQGKYWLVTEGSYGGDWAVYAHVSPVPDYNFTSCLSNPIIITDEACGVVQWDNNNTECYIYTSIQDGVDDWGSVTRRLTDLGVAPSTVSAVIEGAEIFIIIGFMMVLFVMMDVRR